MRRRTFTTGVCFAVSAGLAGCASQTSTDSPSGSVHSGDNNEDSAESVSTEFATTDPRLSVEAAPEVEEADGVITAAGTVRYGSSVCGTAALVYAGYERSQSRLDLLVGAVDGTESARECTDDLADTGYRVTATVDDSPRRVAVTEHHVFGEAYSTTLDLTDY
jgi:hypothetical protein